MRYKLALIPDEDTTPESNLEIDKNGQPTLSIECAAGTFYADVESQRNTAHNGIYLSFVPKNSTDSIDIAAIKDTDDPNTIQLLVWGDVFTEDPSEELYLNVDTINEALGNEN